MPNLDATRTGRLLAVVAAAGLVVVSQPPVSASAADYQRTVRVNLSSTGTQADTDPNGSTYGLAISAHGRYVAFTSDAGNLVPGDAPFRYSPQEVARFRLCRDPRSLRLTLGA